MTDESCAGNILSVSEISKVLKGLEGGHLLLVLVVDGAVVVRLLCEVIN